VDGEPIGYDRIEQLAVESEDVIASLRAIRGVTIDDDATALVISRSPDR